MEQIYQLLHQIGIKRTYLGYYHLATAISLVMENEERLLYIYKWLYEDVAHIHQTTPLCVERNIRTVKTNCYKKGNFQLIQEITGSSRTDIPCNSDFIDMLSCYMKEHGDSKIS